MSAASATTSAAELNVSSGARVVLQKLCFMAGEQAVAQTALAELRRLYPAHKAVSASEADVIVAKHRNGPTKDIVLAFQGHYSRFNNMARDGGF